MDPGDADTTAAAAAAAERDEVAVVEARVAALHARAQALNKQPGEEAAATAVYKEMAALDDRALELSLARAPTLPSCLGRAARALPAYSALLPTPPTWRQAAAACGIALEQLRGRAAAAVLGAALGDAAACGVQWVYSEPELQSLAAGRPGLEFFEPPQCPFFDYPAGAASPYGEQTRALLTRRAVLQRCGAACTGGPGRARRLVETGGLNCCALADRLFADFGPGFQGYRDRSTKAFLRRYAAGALPPLTGGPDDQANAFARLPPLVALYAGAGRRELLGAAERMIRVTQNDPVAVAYGCAAALVLEGVVLGGSATAAVADAVAWLQQQQAAAAEAAGDAASAAAMEQQAHHKPAQKQHQQQQQAEAVPPVPPALWGEVAARLLQAAALAPLPPLEAAERLGRNCHLPNSLQTPLHVLLHLEHALWQRELHQQQGEVHQPVTADGGSVSNAQADAAAAPPAGAAAEVEADFCLPCSMGGGTACHLPSRAGQEAAAGAALLQAAKRRQEQQQGPAVLPAESYADAVRLAIRPGGCCASRAGFVGALAGALGTGAAGDSSTPLPSGWVGKARGWAELATDVERLLSLKD